MKADGGLFRARCTPLLCGVIFALLMSMWPHVGLTRTSGGGSVASEAAACSVCEPTPGELLLCAKNPRTWKVDPNGAGARLNYSSANASFSLSGHKLEPHTRYVLVQHEAAYPSATGYMVASAVSDTGGNIRLQGTWKRWQGKFWLVPDTDVSGHCGDGQLDRLVHWNPERYLFEQRVL